MHQRSPGHLWPRLLTSLHWSTVPPPTDIECHLSSSPPTVVPLRAVRQLAGLTVGELAKRAGCTPAWVSQVESGLRKLSIESAEPFAAALGVSPSFLAGKALAAPSTPVQYRHVRATKADQKGRAEARAAVLQGVVGIWRSTQPALPCLDLPDLGDAANDPEKAAELVREHWCVGPGVIPNLTALLESWGAWVFELPAEDRAVDAYSWWGGNDAFIAANPIPLDPDIKVDDGHAARNAYRERFSLAHELGHLLMHRELDPELVGTRAVEAAAHRFAGAFLVPAGSWPRRSPKSAHWRDYVREAALWGVSASVLLRRDHDLQLVSENVYRSAMIGLSADVGRKSEGSHLVPRSPEEPRRLHDAFAGWFRTLGAVRGQRGASEWTLTLAEKVRQFIAPELPSPCQPPTRS
jgi:transcriptional regulator with XRE-family HTH domain